MNRYFILYQVISTDTLEPKFMTTFVDVPFEITERRHIQEIERQINCRVEHFGMQVTLIDFKRILLK